MLHVRPHLYQQLGATLGVHFRLLTNPRFSASFHIEDSDRYETTGVVTFMCEDELAGLLEGEVLPRPSHLLVVAPDSGFSSPAPERLGRERKLLVLPCNSSSIEEEDIQHYLGAMEATDVVAQKDWSDRFFRAGEAASYLTFTDEDARTFARFDHLNEGYEWFEQLGPLDWGGQQFCPAGEISVLPMVHGRFDPSRRLALTGELALRGLPIVNSGTLSFLREDQDRIFGELACLESSTVIATVENGGIQTLREGGAGSGTARAMLEALFRVDSRYRIIWEIGIGSNTTMTPLPANRTPNESYGHHQGCVHWGLGLTPWTQYHVDLLCPDTVVATDRGEHLAGGHGWMSRKASPGCPCVR
ncbi:hypothetical protein [Geothrix sp. 21YS21S-2]|uniref:hypothetical protein n=1 Tax=Geothrix sp. 21YS21S-2 TaxID=3068893 RepID=UPI0027BA3812|nr:hypothetical protein [Geothrix sp. 21YS21S-2]